jgi:hypothetical protein
MKNSEIKYSLSRDYERLHTLLKSGVIIVGFIAIDIDGVPNKNYSKIVEMSYKEQYQMFDLGFSFFEQNFDKKDFSKLCENQNLQYFDIHI